MKTYLSVPDVDLTRAVSLGAECEVESGKLFVPAGRSLSPFQGWLPSEVAGRDLVIPSERGSSLSEVLARVSRAVHVAFSDAVWVRLEVADVKMRNGGSLYIDAVERDASGKQVAKASAIVWPSRFSTVMKTFTAETGGMELRPGIKLLALAKPKFSVGYGLSLEIEAIDATFSLGDMEKRLRDIRATIAQKGYGEKNKQLAVPVDFFHVAVIAPAEAAGLGDFRAEADKLEQAGICRFSYCEAIFQGERALESIKDAFIAAHQADQVTSFCALALIRGGGATADLQWLNEFLIAAMVCRFPRPVFVGVGHEKDQTILDEFAHTSFGTPSKVIGHIRQTIVARAGTLEKNFNEIVSTAQSRLNIAESRADAAHVFVTTNAMRKLDLAAHKVDGTHMRVGSLALSCLTQAEERANNLIRTISERAETAVMTLDRTVETSYAQVLRDAQQTIDAAAIQATQCWQGIEAAATQSIINTEHELERDFSDVKFFAARSLDNATSDVEDLMTGILAHSIEPTLKRGFAIVKTDAGAPVSNQAKALEHEHLTIQFKDGHIPVTLRKTT